MMIKHTGTAAVLFTAVCVAAVMAAGCGTLVRPSGILSESSSDGSSGSDPADLLQITVRVSDWNGGNESFSEPAIDPVPIDLGDPDDRSLAERRAEQPSPGAGKEPDGIAAMNEDVQQTLIRRYRDGAVLWTYRYDAEFFSNGFLETADGFYVYGTEYVNRDFVNVTYGRLFLFDPDGHLRWSISGEAEGTDYHTAIAVEDGIVLLGRRIASAAPGGDPAKYMIIRKYDSSGNLVFSHEMAMDSYFWASGAAFLDGKYYVDYKGQGRGILATVQENGGFLKQYVFTIGGDEYAVQDVEIFGGRCYLSCLHYGMDDAALTSQLGTLMDEYLTAWGKCSDPMSGIEMPADYRERLSGLMQQYFSAALILCTPDMEIEKIYTISRAEADRFEIRDGTLIWHAFRIDRTENALPVLSSRRLEIASTDFALSFDETGTYIGKKDMGYHEIWY